MLSTLIIVTGLICCLAGIIGSILPVLPGPTLSWVGLLLLYLNPEVPFDWTFIIITFIVAAIMFAMDYIVPAAGTKYFGGSKAGAYGCTIGLIVGLFMPPFGFLIGPFLGAFIGEIAFNSNSNTKHALKSAIGSFIGFLASTFMKVMVAFIYLGLFIYQVFQNWDVMYS